MTVLAFVALALFIMEIVERKSSALKPNIISSKESKMYSPMSPPEVSLIESGEGMDAMLSRKSF